MTELARFEDQGSSWLVTSPRGSARMIALVVPTSEWGTENAPLTPLLSEAWAGYFRNVLLRRGLAVQVSSFWSIDYAGIALQSEPDQYGALVAVVLSHVNDHSFLSSPVSDRVRKLAVRKLSLKRYEYAALERFASSVPTYGVSFEQRAEILTRGSLMCLGEAFAKSKKSIFCYGDPGVLRTELLEVGERTKVRQETAVFPVRRNDGADSVIIQTRTDNGVADTTIVTNGTKFGDSGKYTAHVLWCLIRSTEGVFIPPQRSSGPSFYSLAAFSREYLNGGYGFLRMSTRAPDAERVVALFRNALRAVSEGKLDPTHMSGAIEQLQIDHLRARSNPRSNARMSILRLLSGTVGDDYAGGVAAVTRSEIAGIARSILRSGVDASSNPGA